MSKMSVTTVPVTPFQQNCTLIADEATREAVVVDPGGDADLIRTAIDLAGFKVVAIWLTHGHLDHAGGAEALRGSLQQPGRGKIEILGPDARDAFLLRSIERQAASYGLSGLHNASPDRWLEEGDTTHVGPHSFQVLHCPGHTPGHIVFCNREERFAQVGDVLFHGSVGRTDFPYGDHAALIQSIKTKLLPLGDDISFICGHGPGSNFGAERRSNPFLR